MKNIIGKRNKNEKSGYTYNERIKDVEQMQVDMTFDEIIEEFGFTYKILGEYVIIKSKFDSWLLLKDVVDSLPHSNYKANNKIILYHMNNRGSAGKHLQSKCVDLYNVMSYIARHDNKYIKEYKSYNRIFHLIDETMNKDRNRGKMKKQA